MKLTGIAFNGMANSAQESEMGDKIVLVLENLANTAVQRNDTFEQLVAANTTLTKSIRSQQDKNKKLLTIITSPSTSNRGGRSESGGGRKSTTAGPGGSESNIRGIQLEIVGPMDSRSSKAIAARRAKTREKGITNI